MLILKLFTHTNYRQVFSLYKNKIIRLPAYLTQFKRLHILRIEQNPLEWPPKAVLELGATDSHLTAKDWIKEVQKWMAENSGLPEHGKSGDESGFINDFVRRRQVLSVSGPDIVLISLSVYRDDSSRIHSPVNEGDYDHGQTPHARSFSVASNASVYSLEETQASLGPPSSAPRPGRVLPSHLGSLSTSISIGSSISPSYSPDSYLPTPEESISSTDDDVSRYYSEAQSHARNASYAGSSRLAARSSRLAARSSLTGKKSLPDLRPARLRLNSDADAAGLPSIPVGTQVTFTTPLRVNKSLDNFPMPSPISYRQDSSESDAFSVASITARPFAHGPVSASPTSLERPAPPMDVERNSYFRRFSTLPSSTISKTIPSSLLSLVDAVRGILFAVSQVYQTLQHYTVYAIDERLSSVLLKVLDPASNYMTQLINALDRFDSMSRRTVPTPSVCRAVIESCKDNVTVFGKAVGVLALQLKVLATRDDVRYTRQMLLVLYGATAEISNAWQSMTPHIDAVEPLLRDHRPPPVGKVRSMQPILPGLEQSPSPSPSPVPSTAPVFVPPHTPRSPVDSPGGRTHMARRHAGSFSSKDVEIGKSLPSHLEFPNLQGGIVTGNATDIPTPRAALRLAGFVANQSATTPNRSPFKASKEPWDSHSRQGSQTSLVGSSTGSSPSILGRMPTTELPSDLSTLVDKEAIEAMFKAVEAAPPVWSMMDTMLADVPERREEVRESLGKAQVLTDQLKEGILALQAGVQVDRKALREDAHLFVKVLHNLYQVFSVTELLS